MILDVAQCAGKTFQAKKLKQVVTPQAKLSSSSEHCRALLSAAGLPQAMPNSTELRRAPASFANLPPNSTAHCRAPLSSSYHHRAPPNFAELRLFPLNLAGFCQVLSSWVKKLFLQKLFKVVLWLKNDILSPKSLINILQTKMQGQVSEIWISQKKCQSYSNHHESSFELSYS